MGLEPNKTKPQCLEITAGVLDNSSGWLKKKEVGLRDPVTGEVIVVETGAPVKVHGAVVCRAPIGDDGTVRS